MTTKIRFIIFGMIVFSGTLLSQDPTYYIRKSTWHETMRASREALVKMRGGDAIFAQRVLGPWYAIGPFKSTGKSAFSEAFEPEKEIDLAKLYKGGTIKWNKRTDWPDGKVVDLGPETLCAMYLFRTLTVDRDTILPASLGSDDGVKVWVNGTEVLANNIDRGTAPDQERIDLVLKKGENKFLMKINNNQGGFGFYFRLEDAGINSISKLVKRDFTDARSTMEMGWEIGEGLWDKEWKPGDWSDLAGRYVRAAMFDTPKELESALLVADKAAAAGDLERVRELYIRTHEANATPYVLTPKPSPGPRINSARVFGVRPGSPFLYTIAATGDRPMEFSVEGLPDGLSLDKNTGRITGTVSKKGTNTVTLKARNSLGTATSALRIVIGDQIALTPPLGWNSWNCFASAVDDSKVRSAADAMVKSGLVNHGWTYINIDDCWEIKPQTDDPALMGAQRNEKGMINTNKKFPDMKGLSDYVHAQGLKMGIYSSPGPLTCAGFTASYQFEEKDALQYAEWGIDYLKYDWCSYGRIAKDGSLPELKKPYEVMRTALNKVQRDIVYSLCQYGMGDVWKWGGEVGGNSWRTTGDIEDTWESMSGIGFSQAGHELYAKPGNWNDPDMLVVGKVGWGPQLHPTRLTPNEQYTHISLWCLLNSPLLIGCDMTQLDEFTQNLLTNDEVLEVSQDPLGKQAARVSKDGDLEVWAKDMEDGSKAVGFFNRGVWKSEIKVRWSDLGVQGRHVVRDLWRQKDLGSFNDEFKASVPRHGVVLVRLSKL
ncbi:MAG: putative Ig domain-containing protein [Ignavibacteriales bacterium]|nr:putative Ig domain-containing protein [Ignavibacteriales bacterium]